MAHEAKHAPRTTVQFLDAVKPPDDRVCRAWAKHGDCKRGTECKYLHPTKATTTAAVPPPLPPPTPAAVVARDLDALLDLPYEAPCRLTNEQKKTLQQVYGCPFESVGTRHDPHAVLAHARRTCERAAVQRLRAHLPGCHIMIVGGNPARTRDDARIWHCEPATTERLLDRVAPQRFVRACRHSAMQCTCMRPDFILLSMVYRYTPQQLHALVLRAEHRAVYWLMHPMPNPSGDIANELMYRKTENHLRCTILGTAGVQVDELHDWLFSASHTLTLSQTDAISWSTEQLLPEPCPTQLHTIIADTPNDEKATCELAFQTVVADHGAYCAIPTKDPLIKVFTDWYNLKVTKTASFGPFVVIYAGHVNLQLPKQGIEDVAFAVAGEPRNDATYRLAIRKAKSALAKFKMSLHDQAASVVPVAILGYLKHYGPELGAVEGLGAYARKFNGRWQAALKLDPVKAFDLLAFALSSAQGRLVPHRLAAFATGVFRRLGGNNRDWYRIVQSDHYMGFVAACAAIATAFHARDTDRVATYARYILGVAVAAGAATTACANWSKHLTEAPALALETTFAVYHDATHAAKVPVVPVDGVYTMRDIPANFKTQPIVDVDAESKRTNSTLPEREKIAGRLSGFAINRVPTFPAKSAINVERALDHRVLTPVLGGVDFVDFRNFVKLNARSILFGDKGTGKKPVCQHHEHYLTHFNRYVARLPVKRREVLQEAVKKLEMYTLSGVDHPEYQSWFKHKAILKMEKQIANDAADRVVQACTPEINAIVSPASDAMQTHLKDTHHEKAMCYFSCGSRAESIGACVTDMYHRNMYVKRQDVSKCDSSYEPGMVEALMELVTEFFSEWKYLPGLPNVSIVDVIRKQLMECRGRLEDVLYDAHCELASGVHFTTWINYLRVVCVSLYLRAKQDGLPHAGAVRFYLNRWRESVRANPHVVFGVDNGHLDDSPAPPFRLMGTGDDSVRGDNIRDAVCDAPGLNTRIKSELSMTFELRYCSKMFYPVTTRQGDFLMPGMIIGRAMVGLGTQFKQPYLPDAEFVRGVALGLIQDNNHVPIVNAMLRRMLALTQGVKATTIHDEHNIHTSSMHYVSTAAYDAVYAAYGVHPTVIASIERAIGDLGMGMVHCMADATPFLDEVTTKDIVNGVDHLVNTGPPKPVPPVDGPVVRPLGSNTAPTIGPMLRASAMSSNGVFPRRKLDWTDVLLVPAGEEIIKRVHWTFPILLAAYESRYEPDWFFFRVGMHCSTASMPGHMGWALHTLNNFGAWIGDTHGHPFVGLSCILTAMFSSTCWALLKLKQVGAINLNARVSHLAVVTALATSSISRWLSPTAYFGPTETYWKYACLGLPWLNQLTAPNPGPVVAFVKNLLARLPAMSAPKRRPPQFDWAQLLAWMRSGAPPAPTALSPRVIAHPTTNNQAILNALGKVAPTYGNYGGPGTDLSSAPPPIDSLDAAFRDHDIGYANNQHDQADTKLVADIERLFEEKKIHGVKAALYANLARRFFKFKQAMPRRPRLRRKPSSAAAAPAPQNATRSRSKAARSKSRGSARRNPSRTQQPARSAPATRMPATMGSNRDSINGRVATSSRTTFKDRVFDYEVSDTSIADGKVIFNVQFNPQNFPNCPRMRMLGKQWSRYRVNRLVAHIKTKCSTSVTGAFMAYWDPNPKDNPEDYAEALRKTIASGHQGMIEGAWWGREYRVVAPRKPDLLYTDFRAEDVLFTCSHRLVVIALASAGFTSGSNILDITLEADLDFANQTIEEVITTANGPAYLHADGATSLAAAHPLGTDPVVSSQQPASSLMVQNLGSETTFVCSDDVVVFKIGGSGENLVSFSRGRWFLLLEYSNGGGSLTAPATLTAFGTQSVVSAWSTVVTSGTTAKARGVIDSNATHGVTYTMTSNCVLINGVGAVPTSSSLHACLIPAVTVSRNRFDRDLIAAIERLRGSGFEFPTRADHHDEKSPVAADFVRIVVEEDDDGKHTNDPPKTLLDAAAGTRRPIKLSAR